MTRIIQQTDRNLSGVITQAQEILKIGGLVVFPSDTVYGLLVDATNEHAVDKLLAFKDRPPGKAVSVFVPSFASIPTYVHVNSKNRNILHRILPGPYTIALSSCHKLDTRLESERGTLGIRLPRYAPVNKLVSRYGSPITATSANMAGRSPHHSITSLLNQLSEKKKHMIDLIVDAGKLRRNKPSTVIDLSGDIIKTLRQGDVSLQDAQTFTSTSPEQTQDIGARIATSHLAHVKDKPVVILLKGDLGTGKTEMARGIASYFNINNIISPTYVVYYEYDILVTNYQKFIHVDLYNVQEEEEFTHLGLESYLKPGNVMVVEWGEKLGSLYESLKKKAHVVYVEINHVSENERKILIKS